MGTSPVGKYEDDHHHNHDADDYDYYGKCGHYKLSKINDQDLPLKLPLCPAAPSD